MWLGLLLYFIRLVDPAASRLLHELNVYKPDSVKELKEDVELYVFGGYE